MFLSNSSVGDTGSLLSVALVARREGIVAGGYGIRVAPAAVFTLDADFAPTQIANRIFRGLLGFALGAMNAAGPVSAAFRYGPIGTVPDHEPVILRHLDLQNHLTTCFTWDKKLYV
jgi:hypothetical protein